MNKKIYLSELVDIESLKEHPRNYRRHGEDQKRHIIMSIDENGVYKNAVVANDLTILAGHGVIQTAKNLGFKQIAVVKLDISPNSDQALKILTGDNEISKLAEVDDRALTELLKEISSIKVDALIGTGFDQSQLANLLYVTRPSTEIKDFDSAAEWVGLPTYDEKDETLDQELELVIKFENESNRENFVKENKIEIGSRRGGRKWSTFWPFKERNDIQSVKFENIDET